MAGPAQPDAPLVPAPDRAAARPPMEVVLPTVYYAILVAESIGLCILHFKVPEETGGDRIGMWLGWAGTASMVLMHVYSIRRRVRALSRLGPLRAWLEFHIFMGLQGALLVTYHASHLSTLWNLSGINIALVLVVVASGCFGRYLYALLPKSVSGERLTVRQIEDELASLTVLAQRAAPTPELAAAVAAYGEGAVRLTGRTPIAAMVREDARSRRAARELDKALRASLKQVVVMSPTDLERVERFAAQARRRASLARRLVTVAAAERVFRHWSTAHKPITYVLAATTLLHVLGHYLFMAGYGG